MLGQALALVAQYQEDPVYAHTSVGLLVLGVTVASAHTVPTPARSARGGPAARDGGGGASAGADPSRRPGGVDVVGGRGHALFAAGCALVMLSSTVNLVLQAGSHWGWPEPRLSGPGPAQIQTGPATLPLYAIAAALMLRGLVRPDTAVQRRFAALRFPAAVLLAGLALLLRGYALTPVVQAVALAGAPVLAYLLGVAAVRARRPARDAAVPAAGAPVRGS